MRETVGQVIRAWAYFGGKVHMVDRILSCLPEGYTSWYELFIGGGSVTFSKSTPSSCKKEVINDYDMTIANFYRVLADETWGDWLIQELLYRGMGKDVFEKAKKYVVYHCFGSDNLELAVSTYIEIAQSFSAWRKNYANGRDILTYQNNIRKHLPKVRERLKSIDIRNEDALDILDSIKEDEGAMVYLDPPYRKELRNGGGYRCELDTYQQIRLLKILQKCKCKIILSGYREETDIDLYDSYLLPYGFKVYKLCDVVKSCQTKLQKDAGSEYIWCNYELPVGALVEDEIIPRYRYVQYDELQDDRIIKNI